MHLKGIQVFGFKSFAQKTNLSFEGGVTAIVGPNGVGKSNIAEAIRWVLGEQSARELRGVRMEDVIFNGTETRSPVNFCEVSLTFYNEQKILPIDYDEVTITRRVFRTGESQYLLNKTAVRLKDISDLLMGTGVGLDSYSIIGQGKIDLILSSKPEDRRYIFEEAAGITKYKSRKKEALRKLEYTEDNLLRINDILKEVSRQITSIERQARKAEKYKERFEQLKEKEVKVSFYILRNLKNEFNSHSTQNDKCQEEGNSFLEEIDKMSSLLREAKQKLFEIDEKLNSLYTKRVNIDAQIENANRSNSVNNERITEITDRKESLERQIQSTEIKLQELKEQILKSKEELKSLKQDKKDKAQDISQKEQHLADINKEIFESEEKVKESKERIFETTTSESKCRNDLAKITADETNIRARLRRLKIEKGEVDEDLVRIGEKVFKLNQEKDAKEKGVVSLRKQREETFSSLTSRTENLSELKDELAKLSEKYVASQSKLEYLNDLRKRYEGYQEGVKSILAAKGQNQLPQDVIFEPIANLIEVEPGYERAVEAVLGKNAQVIVVRDSNTLKSCIGFLKKNNLGYATFMALDTLREPRSRLNPAKFGFSPIMNFVKTSAEFQIAVNNILFDAYLVENLEDALDKQKRLNSITFKLVTKDGDVIDNNLVTSGTVQAQENSLIGREAKIKILEEEINSYAQMINRLKLTREKEGEEVENLSRALQGLDSSLQEEEINLANILSSYKSTEEERKRSADEVSLLNLEISESEEEENKLKLSKQNLESRVEEMNKASFELSSVITTSEDIIKSKKTEREGLLINITQLKTELSSFTDLEINQNQTVKMVEDANGEQLALLNTQKQEIEDSKIKLESLRSEIEKTNENIKTFQAERQAALTELENMSEVKNAHFKEIKKREESINSKKEELEGLKNTLHGFEVKRTELGYQMQNIKDRIFENYKVELEATQIEIEEDFNQEQIKGEIEQLKKRLDSMGTVNLVAIEEHKELKERFEFLSKQRQDLEEAKESLHKAIAKINRTTRKLFIETFASIQVNFKEFFRMLFGGGGAELILLDERDVLESGIEIIVRPPGKKLQNISLLSGGEKALTAIALLFAIFKVKPSPFCILDEIDAPLDEANVDRFTRVLQDFLKTSQFIVITHNKKTIGMADVMYGVTMEEAGISKIISVKFKDSSEIAEEEIVASS